MQGAQLWFSVHGIVAANRGDTFSSSDSWSSKIETTNKQQLFSVSKIYNLIKQQEMFKKKTDGFSLFVYKFQSAVLLQYQSTS
jgi:hypothetical protein